MQKDDGETGPWDSGYPKKKKKILKDVSLSQMFMTAGIFIGTLVLILLALSVKCLAFSPAIILGYNLLWLLIMLLVQAFRRY